MRPLAAADVCRAVSGTFLQAGGDTVTGVTSDSRRIAPGDLFIPWWARGSTVMIT